MTRAHSLGKLEFDGFAISRWLPAAMPLKIKCPEGHELVVPIQRAGRRVRCPICKNTVVVPTVDAETLARHKRTAIQPTTKKKKARTAPTQQSPTVSDQPQPSRKKPVKDKAAEAQSFQKPNGEALVEKPALPHKQYGHEKKVPPVGVSLRDSPPVSESVKTLDPSAFGYAGSSVE